MKRFLKNVAQSLEEGFDSLSYALKKRLGSDAPLQIVTFRSYGNSSHVYVKGRLLHDKGVVQSQIADSLWENLVNMYKRFSSDEVPGARLKITFNNNDYEVITDEEGYFTWNFHSPTPIVSDSMWYEVKVVLLDSPFHSNQNIESIAHILIPPADAEYGVISDIDDTIIKTTATSLLAMSKNTFFHNAHSRLPFAGVAEFYKSLQLGRNGKRNNPFFYVSSSPWNLYDLLIDFLDINEIPEGPLLLRDFGLDRNKQSDDHMGHKFNEIKNILLTYPNLNFVLIGDSGQEDPKIYREVVQQFPGRIIAIYIRDVQLADREKIAIDVSNSLKGDNVPMLIVDNTVEAADHAATIGLIFREDISKIIVDKKVDKGEIFGKEVID